MKATLFAVFVISAFYAVSGSPDSVRVLNLQNNLSVEVWLNGVSLDDHVHVGESSQLVSLGSAKVVNVSVSSLELPLFRSTLVKNTQSNQLVTIVVAQSHLMVTRAPLDLAVVDQQSCGSRLIHAAPSCPGPVSLYSFEAFDNALFENVTLLSVQPATQYKFHPCSPWYSDWVLVETGTAKRPAAPIDVTQQYGYFYTFFFVDTNNGPKLFYVVDQATSIPFQGL